MWLKKQNRKQQMALLSLVVVAAASIAAWQYSSRTKASATQTKPTEKTIATVQTIRLGTLQDSVVFPGVIKADGVVAVTSFSEGIVAACSVKLGQKVHKGQALCKVENDNPGATYLPHSVESPIAGLVGEIHANIGTRVNKGDKIVTILRSTQAKVEIEVPVQDAPKFRVGAKANWQKNNDSTTHAPSGAQNGLNLVVTGVSPLPDMATRTVRIELSPQTGNPGLPGELGRVAFVFNSRQGIEISADAVQYQGLDPFLRKVTNNRVKWVPVKLGRLQNGKQEILEGVANGDVVVLNAAKFIADNEEIVTKSENIAEK
jgi:multidrug efflux pump subunit AcrA (membrane-fusion protein)